MDLEFKHTGICGLMLFCMNRHEELELQCWPEPAQELLSLWLSNQLLGEIVISGTEKSVLAFCLV